MSAQQRVRTTCASCGTVEVPFDDAVVVVTAECLRIAYTCPTCSAAQSWPLDRATSRLLMNAGLAVAVGDAPVLEQPARTSRTA